MADMFALRSPCVDCPFTKKNARNFALGKERIEEIVSGPAFPCHKTIDYDAADRDDLDDDDDGLRAVAYRPSGPMQCPGLMAILHKAGRPNQIMQVAQRLGHFDPTKLDASDVFDSVDDLIAAHMEGRKR